MTILRHLKLYEAAFPRIFLTGKEISFSLSSIHLHYIYRFPSLKANSSTIGTRGVDTEGVDKGCLSPKDAHACFDIEETEVQEFNSNQNQAFEAETLSSFPMAVTDFENCVHP